MRRLTLTMVSALVLLLGVSVSTSASGHNCGDYVSQAAAQSVYLADTSDPNGLDGPPGPTSAGQPGVACETYDYANNPGTNPGLLGGGTDVTSPGTGTDDGADDDNGDDNGNGGAGELPSVGSGPMTGDSASAAPLLGAFSLVAAGAAMVIRRTGVARS